MTQTEEFMLQNVSYRPTVYRTGGGSAVHPLPSNPFIYTYSDFSDFFTPSYAIFALVKKFQIY